MELKHTDVVSIRCVRTVEESKHAASDSAIEFQKIPRIGQLAKQPPLPAAVNITW